MFPATRHTVSPYLTVKGPEVYRTRQGLHKGWIRVLPEVVQLSCQRTHLSVCECVCVCVCVCVCDVRACIILVVNTLEFYTTLL